MLLLIRRLLWDWRKDLDARESVHCCVQAGTGGAVILRVGGEECVLTEVNQFTLPKIGFYLTKVSEKLFNYRKGDLRCI